MSVTVVLDEKLLERGDEESRRLPKMADEEYWEFTVRNPELHTERNRRGDVILMPPTGGETGRRNTALTRYLDEWAEQTELGVTFDSSTTFTMPLGGNRSPDVSWVQQERWDALTDREKEQFPPLCPDFVVELRSPSETIASLQRKMEEYVENGAMLGWLIDPLNRRVYVYRPGQEVEVLENPTTVSAEPELPGFVLEMRRIF
jgi:Uma2 family endonuclease